MGISSKYLVMPKESSLEKYRVGRKASTPSGLDVEQTVADVASKVGPFMGGPFSAASQPIRALQSEGMRDIAKTTTVPLTAAVTGGIPGLLGLAAGGATYGGLRMLPRAAESKAVEKVTEKLPEEIPGMDIASKVAPFVSQAPLSGLLKLASEPKKKIKELSTCEKSNAKYSG